MPKRRTLRKGALAFLFLMAGTCQIWGQTSVQITTKDGVGSDSYITWDGREASNNYLKGANFGSSPSLSILDYHLAPPAENAYRKVYLRFDLTNAPALITSAKLVVTPSATNDFHFIDIYALHSTHNADEQWNESDINWDNAPGNLAGDDIDQERCGYYGTISAHGPKDIPIERDLPPNLIDLLNTAGDLVTLILVPHEEGPNATSYYSKEGTTDAAKKPTLILGSTIPLAQPIVGEQDGGISGGYSITNASNTHCTVIAGGFDADPCIQVQALSVNAQAQVNFPVPPMVNHRPTTAYYLLTCRVKLVGNARFRLYTNTSQNNAGSSQEVRFMTWTDTDTSDWMNLQTGITLPPGASLTDIHAVATCPTVGDIAHCGSAFLESTSQAEATSIDNPQTNWPDVQQSDLDPQMLRGVVKGNLIRNAGFEAGTTMLDSPFAAYPGLTTANPWQGARCLTLQTTGFLGRRSVWTRHFRITPGKVYTLSFYGRADANNVWIEAGIFSGWQWSDNCGFLTSEKPAARHLFTLGTTWKRYSFSFIPRYASKSCAQLYFSNNDVNPTYYPSYIDGVQLEEGFLSNYQPERAVDVGLNRATPDETGLVLPGTPVSFNVDVYAQQGGGVDLTYTLQDYWGTVVETRTATVNTTADRGTRSTVMFTPTQPGIYKVITQYQQGTVTGYAEERSFGVLPMDFPATGSNPASYFGGHCQIDQPYGLATMAKLGMKWIRLHDQAYSFVNNWKDVETASGSFSWTAGDTAVNAMRAQNLNILGRLGGSLADVPAWISINPTTKLPDLAAWNSYVHNIVSHYAGRIDHWEVWNEPYWDFGSVPQSYVDLLWSTYQQIKLANPNAKVVGVCGHLGDLGLPAPDNWESEWFRTVLQLAGNCPEYPMDIVSHHNYLYYPYPELFPSPAVSLQARLATLKTWLQTYSPNKTIAMWDTEHTVRPGLFFTDRLFGADNWWVRFDPWNYDYQDGCNWLVRQYITSLACGQQKLFYFTLNTTEFGRSFSTNALFGTLYDYAQSPDPVALAYAGLAKQLDNTSFVQEIVKGTKTKIYVFSRGTTPIVGIWRKAGQNDRDTLNTLILNAQRYKFSAVNIMGSPYSDITAYQTTKTRLQFSGEPVYIEGIGITVAQMVSYLNGATITEP